MATETRLSNAHSEEIRAEPVNIEQRRQESEVYCVLRPAMISQANGNFSFGERLQMTIHEMERLLTPESLDTGKKNAARAIEVLA